MPFARTEGSGLERLERPGWSGLAGAFPGRSNGVYAWRCAPRHQSPFHAAFFITLRTTVLAFQDRHRERGEGAYRGTMTLEKVTRPHRLRPNGYFC